MHHVVALAAFDTEGARRVGDVDRGILVDRHVAVIMLDDAGELDGIPGNVIPPGTVIAPAMGVQCHAYHDECAVLEELDRRSHARVSRVATAGVPVDQVRTRDPLVSDQGVSIPRRGAHAVVQAARKGRAASAATAHSQRDYYQPTRNCQFPIHMTTTV